MNEKREIKIKTELVKFIKANCFLEGDTEEVNQKVRELSVGIFDIIFPQSESDQNNSDISGMVAV